MCDELEVMIFPQMIGTLFNILVISSSRAASYKLSVAFLNFGSLILSIYPLLNCPYVSTGKPSLAFLNNCILQVTPMLGSIARTKWTSPANSYPRWNGVFSILIVVMFIGFLWWRTALNKMDSSGLSSTHSDVAVTLRFAQHFLFVNVFFADPQGRERKGCFEPEASSLQGRRSTVELRAHEKDSW